MEYDNSVVTFRKSIKTGKLMGDVAKWIVHMLASMSRRSEFELEIF